MSLQGEQYGLIVIHITTLNRIEIEFNVPSKRTLGAVHLTNGHFILSI